MILKEDFSWTLEDISKLQKASEKALRKSDSAKGKNFRRKWNYYANSSTLTSDFEATKVDMSLQDVEFFNSEIYVYHFLSNQIGIWRLEEFFFSFSYLPHTSTFISLLFGIEEVSCTKNGIEKWQMWFEMMLEALKSCTIWNHGNVLRLARL